MYYVYVLIDDNKKIYIGYSSNLERQLFEHEAQKVYTTKGMKNPKLYYYEAYKNEVQAKERESKLKQYGSSYNGLLKRIGLK